MLFYRLSVLLVIILCHRPLAILSGGRQVEGGLHLQLVTTYNQLISFFYHPMFLPCILMRFISRTKLAQIRHFSKKNGHFLPQKRHIKRQFSAFGWIFVEKN